MDNKTKWFADARFGLFIHWGLSAYRGCGVWGRYCQKIPQEEYEADICNFNPTDFDPVRWAELAWDAGMRYVVFTTKHHEGFCMYDSFYTNFKITKSQYGKDITRELTDTFRQKGFKIGYYHSLVDWHHPDYVPCPECPAYESEKSEPRPHDLKKYQQYLYDNVKQLLTQYGKIDILWLDYTSMYKTSAEWDPARLVEMIYRVQPDILLNDRLSYDKKAYLGDFLTPEISVPNQPVSVNGNKMPWESCMTLNEHWGYYPEDHNFKPWETISTALVNCVSKDGNLLMNIGPDAKGNLPPETLGLLKRLADWSQYSGEAYRGAGPASFTAPAGTLYTWSNGVLYLYLMQKPMGDILLPGLRGKIKKGTLLRDGSPVHIESVWGLELLAHDEQRIRHEKAAAGDILKLELL